MDHSLLPTNPTEVDLDRATVLYARTYAQAYASEASNATASRAALRAVLEEFAPHPEDAPQHALIKAGTDLASYASYAEIVGGVSVNRPEIRRLCDEVFELSRPYKRLLEAAEDRDAAADEAALATAEAGPTGADRPQT